ncbi:MAG: LPS export ABC transporter periplasmic protein LptC [Candidatus Omnitrophica bacterium]|nr:LPS export ABC transporter periplasmic protein LptC [Candidatus Omnitrophota bacterium]
MNSAAFRLCLAVSLFICAGGALPGLCAVPKSPPGPQDGQMSDFSLSGFGDKGKKSWDISGRSADIASDVISLNDIVSNFYGEQETVKLKADSGQFNRREGSVHLQDNVIVTSSSGARMKTDMLDWDRRQQVVATSCPVVIEKDNVVISGRGAKGFPDLSKMNLEKDVQVDIDQSPIKDSKNQSMAKIVITCDGSLQVDYQKNIATFNDNVRAVTADGVIKARHIEVYFDQHSPRSGGVDDISSITGSRINRILARGDVEITRGQNVSYSDEALYSAQEKKITLLGRPKLVIYSSEDFNAPVRN